MISFDDTFYQLGCSLNGNNKLDKIPPKGKSKRVSKMMVIYDDNAVDVVTNPAEYGELLQNADKLITEN